MPTLRFTNNKTPLHIYLTKNTLVEKNIDKITKDKKNLLYYTELRYFCYDILFMEKVTYFISNPTTSLKIINACGI